MKNKNTLKKKNLPNVSDAHERCYKLLMKTSINRNTNLTLLV